MAATAPAVGLARSCSHLVVATPKSGSTALAKALCHKAQKQDPKARCFHEPHRGFHTLVTQFKDDPDKTQKKLAGAFDIHVASEDQKQPEHMMLCKDMSYNYDMTGKFSYRQIMETVILNSNNTIVFLGTDPYSEFLSHAKREISTFVKEKGRITLSQMPRILEKIQFKTQCRRDYEGFKALTSYAQSVGKPIVVLKQDDLMSDVRGSLNSILSQWNQTTFSSGESIELVQTNTRRPGLTTGHYEQFYFDGDDWDSVEGSFFSEKKQRPTTEQKEQSIFAHFAKDLQFAVEAHFKDVKKELDAFKEEIDERYSTQDSEKGKRRDEL